MGGSGLLGTSLVSHLVKCGHEVITHSCTNTTQFQGDIGDQQATFNLLNQIRPKVIVNLIGLTDVDRCEAEPLQAYRLNVRTVENIVSWIRQETESCHLIHISTDHIYDGTSPHTEDQVALTNYYAFSKYAGELVARRVPSTIFRTNFFGRSHCVKRTSLTDWLFRALTQQESIQVFDNVLFSPLSISTLSEMLELSIRIRPVGVFNLGSHGGMSKADFAFAFAEESDLSTKVMQRVSTDQIKLIKTYRPKDMRMDCSYFENVLGLKLPSLRNEIKKVVKEYV